jgi:D-cysteine desulfhydrase
MAKKRGGRPVSRRVFVKAGLGAAGVLAVTGGAGQYAALRFNEIGPFDADALRAMRGGRSNHLLDRFPLLADALPWRPLATPNTPVSTLPALDGARDVQLYIKRDDLTSDLYGGNKVRKLEHILAEAELAGRRTLITLGGVGTNHGLATALHGRAAGFAVEVVFFDQPVTAFVKRNLRAFAHAGAELHHAPGELDAMYRARRRYAEAESAGRAPYFVMVGGSSRLGTLGYVNAALELADQVRAGALPEPDRVFVALGSAGTAAGLAAGFRVAGLKTRVCAVRAGQRLLAHGGAVRYMAGDALRYLRAYGADVPRGLQLAGYEVAGEQFGAGYGHPTQEGLEALEWAASEVPLETTYTAKALAACLDYCRRRARPGEHVLYWHTANSTPLPHAGNGAALPPTLRALVGD